MQIKTINSPKPEIRFHRSGLIDITRAVSRKLTLSGDDCKISFVIDDEQNIYIEKNKEGIKPSSIRGRYYRYHAVDVVRKILSHPDVQSELNKVAFRTGEVENGLLPIITRRVI